MALKRCGIFCQRFLTMQEITPVNGGKLPFSSGLYFRFFDLNINIPFNN